MKIFDLNFCKPSYIKFSMYTFQEVIEKIGGNADYNNVSSLSKICKKLNISYKSTLNNDLIIELWNDIFNRYIGQYCISIPNETQFSDAVISLFQKILNIIDRTYLYYSTLINLYESQKEVLLKQLESSSTGLSRFNDTPQDEGTFENDEHTTNLTQTSQVNKTDTTTPILRLKEIETNLRDYFKNWVDEFNILFIPVE